MKLLFSRYSATASLAREAENIYRNCNPFVAKSDISLIKGITLAREAENIYRKRESKSVYKKQLFCDSPLAMGGNPFVAKSDISLIKGITLAREAKSKVNKGKQE